jgi:hypothetical protein
MTRYDRPFPEDDGDELTLFGTAEPPILVPVGPGTIAEAFDRFHSANPWVYDALVKLARDLRRRGRDRVGIGMLFEVLRWQWFMTTTDAASDFKLNNNYRSRYARLIMDREPDLADMFSTRILTSP